MKNDEKNDKNKKDMKKNKKMNKLLKVEAFPTEKNEKDEEELGDANTRQHLNRIAQETEKRNEELCERMRQLRRGPSALRLPTLGCAVQQAARRGCPQLKGRPRQTLEFETPTKRFSDFVASTA